MEFGIEEYDRLAEATRKIKGKMVISVNDIPEMRGAFKGLKTTKVGINYSLGSKSGGPAKRQELVVRSW